MWLHLQSWSLVIIQITWFKFLSRWCSHRCGCWCLNCSWLIVCCVSVTSGSLLSSFGVGIGTGTGSLLSSWGMCVDWVLGVIGNIYFSAFCAWSGISAGTIPVVVWGVIQYWNKNLLTLVWIETLFEELEDNSIIF